MKLTIRRDQPVHWTPKPICSPDQLDERHLLYPEPIPIILYSGPPGQSQLEFFAKTYPNIIFLAEQGFQQRSHLWCDGPTAFVWEGVLQLYIPEGLSFDCLSIDTASIEQHDNQISFPTTTIEDIRRSYLLATNQHPVFNKLEAYDFEIDQENTQTAVALCLLKQAFPEKELNIHCITKPTKPWQSLYDNLGVTYKKTGNKIDTNQFNFLREIKSIAKAMNRISQLIPDRIIEP